MGLCCFMRATRFNKKFCHGLALMNKEKNYYNTIFKNNDSINVAEIILMEMAKNDSICLSGPL